MLSVKNYFFPMVRQNGTIVPSSIVQAPKLSKNNKRAQKTFEKRKIHVADDNNKA
jgi:hypothetical protein